MLVPVLAAQARARAAARSVPRPSRSGQARLEEAVGLSEAIGLDVRHAGTVPLSRPRPANLLGSGKVDELAGLVAALDAELVIVDWQLTPVQQRNLERAFSCKVLDRTGLILEIFGERARTKEGRLQVELAHLNYQKSRLVRSWTHLERQRGGFGFLGGPGERQIEADRRMIQQRIGRIEQELAKVRRTRGLHRSGRQRVPYPVIALVGYTNAGKSTLFNALTGAEMFAEDLLFATLDPTLRPIDLPSKSKVLLSDTVGFISDLPTDLIAAFRATLEEVLQADLIVHVRDISHADSEAQTRDVEQVLLDLGLDMGEAGTPVLEAWNKTDLLAPDQLGVLRNEAERRPDVVLVCARQGQGLEELRAAIDAKLMAGHRQIDVDVPSGAGGLIHWIYENAQVLNRESGDDGSTTLKIRISSSKANQLARRIDKQVEALRESQGSRQHER